MASSLTAQIDLDLYLPRTPVLSGPETARIMGFPTTEALYKARQAGRLPIDLFRLPGRRGWFAATPAVKAWLEASLSPTGTTHAPNRGGDANR
jgi:hypothetical protein